MRIPILGGSWQGRGASSNTQRTKNFLLEVDPNLPSGLLLFSRPGLSSYISAGYRGGSGEVRMLYRDSWGMLNAVVGNAWLRYDTALTETVIGAIGTSAGPVWMTDNSADIMLVDYDGNSAYSYIPTTGAFAVVPLPGDPAGLCLVDAYFTVPQLGSRQFWCSEANSTTFTATRVASKEGGSDRIVTVLTDKREIFLFGEITSEVWYNEGDSVFPLRRRAFLSHGCGAKKSPAILDNSVFFLDNKRQVRRIYGYDAQLVSTRQIEHEWSKYSTASDAIGMGAVWEGHALFLLSFPTANASWVFDVSTNQWTEASSLNGFDEIRFRAQCSLIGTDGGPVTFNDKVLLGDFSTGTIWELSGDAYLDGTERYRKSRAAQVVSNERKTIFFDELWVEAETGVGRYAGEGATTLAADAAASDETITVAAVTGISEGYGLDITLDDGSVFQARVSAIVGTVVGLSRAITGAATSGNAVGFYDYESRYPTIDLDFSDDGGNTWGEKISAKLGGPGDFERQLRWQQLGSASRRVFRWETDAPAKIIISDAYLTARLGVS